MEKGKGEEERGRKGEEREGKGGREGGREGKEEFMVKSRLKSHHLPHTHMTLPSAAP